MPNASVAGVPKGLGGTECFPRRITERVGDA